MTSRKTIQILLLLIFSVLLASCANGLTLGPKVLTPTEDSARSVEQTVEAFLDSLASTETAVAEQTPSSTPTPKDSPTATLSPTPLPPMVEAIEATNCRSGPGTSYIFLGVLKVAESAEVIGRSVDEEFVIIENPDNTGTCWLWLEFVELSGSIDSLPLMDTPPTPTPSLTPTPSIIWADNWFIWVGPEPLTQYTMTIVHVGNTISGSFIAGEGNTVSFTGTLSPDYSYAVGNWTSTAGSSGDFEWQRKQNVNQFIGNLDGGSNEWCGARAGASLPSPCYGP